MEQEEESRQKRARLSAGMRSLELFRSRARLTALVELEEDGEGGSRVACLHPGGGEVSCAACGQTGGSGKLLLPGMLAPMEEEDGACRDAPILENGSNCFLLSPSVTRCEIMYMGL